jgi:hypothetical protein
VVGKFNETILDDKDGFTGFFKYKFILLPQRLQILFGLDPPIDIRLKLFDLGF